LSISKPPVWLVCAAWFLFSYSSPSRPQTAPPADAPDEEILITGAGLEETIPVELSRYGNRLETIDADAIQLGGYIDLSQTLQMQVPGLYIAPKHGPFDYMNCSLQGARCEDTLWLIDGVRINNRLYNTTAPLDTIPAHMIERIEVLYGGQGIFYGTQSVAGVVNVVTRSFSNKPAGSLEAGFDSRAGYHVAGDYRAAFDDHQLVLYASADESDGHRPIPLNEFQPSGTDRERGYEVLTLGAKYAYNFSATTRLSVLYQHTDNEVDNVRPYRAAVRYNARVEDLATAKLDFSVGENIDAYVKGYYHDWDTEWDHITNDLDASGNLTGTRTVLYRDTFWGFEDFGVSAGARIATRHGLDYALGYEYQEFTGADEVWLIADKSETAHGFFGQIRTNESLLENTLFAIGVRHNLTSGNADQTVWNLSGQHNFRDDFYTRATLGTAFRLPDAEELYLMDCCERGNPDLEPEHSFNVNLSVGGRLGVAAGMQWELIGFYREIDNLIDIDFDNPAYPDGIFENFDTQVGITGFEAQVALSLTEEIGAGMNFILNNAEFEDSDEQVQDIPETQFKFNVRYAPMAWPAEAGVSMLYVGDVFDVVSGNRIEHGNYITVDLNGAWYFGANREHRVGFRLENLFDETYASSLARGVRDSDGSSYPYQNLGMPRTFHASYRYQF
jgi:vitamin B12 transporter